MRLWWTVFVGFLFALFLLAITSPVMVAGIGLSLRLLKGDMFSSLSGESVFGVRDQDGRLDGRMINVGFHTIWVAMDGDPRPRRMILRLEVLDSDVFATRMGEGRIRFDAWPVDGAADLRKPPVYSIIASGRSAVVEDTILNVDHGSRHSVYSLADGSWLYDYDVPIAVMSLDGDRRRVVALSAADGDVVPGGIAVLALASDRRVIRRLVIVAQDTGRARLLRSTMSMVRPLIRADDATHRSIDLVLSAGVVRLPLLGDDVDLTQAQLPAGLGVIELRPWGKKS